MPRPPRARSSESVPVEMPGIARYASSSRRMIEPLPKDFSIWPTTRPRAWTLAGSASGVVETVCALASGSGVGTLLSPEPAPPDLPAPLEDLRADLDSIDEPRAMGGLPSCTDARGLGRLGVVPSLASQSLSPPEGSDSDHPSAVRAHAGRRVAGWTSVAHLPAGGGVERGPGDPNIPRSTTCVNVRGTIGPHFVVRARRRAIHRAFNSLCANALRVPNRSAHTANTHDTARSTVFTRGHGARFALDSTSSYHRSRSTFIFRSDARCAYIM
jgi:hypothetical protein